jgi:hypothetical protein
MGVSAAERADFRQAIGPSLATLVRQIAAEKDLGERELEAGSSLPRILSDLPDELVGEALDIVAQADGGPAVLVAMSIAAPTELAVAARVRLEELDDRPAPDARLAVLKAWKLVAADEPVVALTVLCERERAPGAQAFSFVIEDDVSGGAIKDGFVTALRQGRRIAKKLVGNVPDGAALIPLDPDDARAQVLHAAAQGARGGWAPTDDGMEAVRIFLRASGEDDADAVVQALELAEPLACRIDALEEQRLARELDELLAIGEVWLRDQGFPDERVDAAVAALDLMGQFGLFYLGAEIIDWAGDELDAFMFDWMPRKVELEDAERFPAAIGDALGYLAATGRMDERAATSLARGAERNASRFVNAMQDDERQGPAGAILAAMRADGIEIGDESAMQAWLEGFNASPHAARDAVLGPAIERSLPAAAPAPAPAPAPARAPRQRSSRKVQKQARRRNRGR